MQIKTMRDVGALVRTARRARGMTQADLADRLHMSRDWVVRLEKGHPRLEAQRVLDALRVVGVGLDATVNDVPQSAPRTQDLGQSPLGQSDPFGALFGRTDA